MPLTTKKYKLNGNNRGFTLIEMVVVLLLISIIAAAVFTRSIGTNRINFVGQVDKIRNQIRYAQSLAMKRGDVWGITYSSTKDEYWLFQGYGAGAVTAIKLPGEKKDKIALDDIGVVMSGFQFLYFDKYGQPYHMLDYDTPSNTQAVTTAAPLNIIISSQVDASQSRTLQVTPETGFIKTQ
jgi:prepilin-type N-terminal cleavage/methylation domain-containing protein